MNKIDKCIEENLQEIVELYFDGHTVAESIQEVMGHGRINDKTRKLNSKN